MSSRPSQSSAESLADTGLLAFPPVAVALLHLHGREFVHLSEVTDLIGTDPSASAQVVRAANSAFPGVRGETTALAQAAVVLGLRTTISIATASTLSAGSETAPPGLRGCWRHSLATALIAEMLAPAIEASPLAAHSVGFLHDIGRVALAYGEQGAHLDLLRPVPGGCGRNPLEHEYEPLGVSHASVGEVVLQKLRLPDVFQQAARHHHSPIDARFESPLVTLTQVACRTARWAGFDVLEDSAPRAAGSSECVPEDFLRDVPDQIRDHVPEVVSTVVTLMEAYELAL
jgi:putative nucleotidyltransferase with HDIG domain